MARTKLRASQLNTTDLLDFFYPVGTVYHTTADDLNTATKMNNHFGGTWEDYGKGRFLVGYRADEEEFNWVGKVGGNKHMQKHHHDVRHGTKTGAGVTISVTGSGEDVLDVTSWAWRKNVGNGEGSGSNLFTSEVGGGNSGNLPPYVTVYRFRRIG